MNETANNILITIDSKMDKIIAILNSPEQKISFYVSIAALIVAIGSLIFEFLGARKSRKEFLINLKEQQRSNNISLFDKRQEILECVKNGEFDFSLDRAEMLFDEKILNQIKECKNIKMQKRMSYEKSTRYRNTIFIASIEQDIKDDLIKAIEIYDKHKMEPATTDMFEAARRYIINNPLTIENEMCDYVTISENICKYTRALNECKSRLEHDIKEFIKNSISK